MSSDIATSAPESTWGFDSIFQKERVDTATWARHAEHAAGEGFLRHKLDKLATARVFIQSLQHHAPLFDEAGDVLELGGGSCWAAHLVASMYPDARVVGTDIAPAAVESHTMWEEIFGSTLADAVPCRSYDIPYEDDSFDLVFCFEAAHHFGKHRRTFEELNRVLRPGGHALYLHEPGCRRFLYPLAHRRVNKKRPEVPEDVLVYKELVDLAEEVGLECRIAFDPSLVDRGPKQTLYFMGLRALPVLQHLLPCTVDVVLHKPAEA